MLQLVRHFLSELNSFSLQSILLCTLVMVLLLYSSYSFNYWLRFKNIIRLKGPSSFPIIGSSFIFCKAKSTKDVFDILNKLVDDYELPFSSSFGPFLVYFTMIPEELKIIFSHPGALKKSFPYNFFSKLSKDSIFISAVPKWKQMRKLISPTFNQNVLNDYHPTLVAKSEKMSDHLRSLAGSGSFDVRQIIDKISVETICATAMGVDIDNEKYKFDYVNLTHKLLNIATERLGNLFYYIDFIYERSRMAAEENSYAEIINNFIEKVIQEKKEKHMRHLKNEKLDMQYEEDTGIKIRKPFLELLLEISDEKQLSDQEINNEVSTFLFAGSDTTAATTCFALICLGMHPDIQEKMYNEVTNVIGTSRSVALDDLPKLVYTEMIIKEVLRLFPVAPYLLRELTSDVDLGERKLPAGLLIFMPILKLHRSPEYWKNPLKFDPDRYTPQETSKRHPFTWLAFSGGPRNCIGKRYAMMSLKTILATLIRDFKITTDYKSIEEVELEVAMVLKCSKGFNCSVVNRH